jgi:hypothetical protein
LSLHIATDAATPTGELTERQRGLELPASTTSATVHHAWIKK